MSTANTGRRAQMTRLPILLAAWAVWDRLPASRRIADVRRWLLENQMRLAPAVVGTTLVLFFYAALGGMEQGGSGLNAQCPPMTTSG